MENQLSETDLHQERGPVPIKMKLTCKFIEYRLLQRAPIDFSVLDKLFETRSHFQNLFEVNLLRSELFVKNLEHVGPSLSLSKDRRSRLAGDSGRNKTYIGERRSTGLSEKKQGLVDLSFINQEMSLVHQRNAILEKIRNILGDSFNEILPYGDFLSAQKGGCGIIGSRPRNQKRVQMGVVLLLLEGQIHPPQTGSPRPVQVEV